MFFQRPLKMGLMALLLSLPCFTQAASDVAASANGTWPSRPIHFVAGFPPGGPSDVLARSLGKKLGELLKISVIVDNRPGAGGDLAAEYVAKSAPDGYTWLLGNNSILATNAALYRNLPFDPIRDFAAVGLVGIQPSILVVNNKLPVTSVKELIAYAKANPGKLNFASSGTGAAAHLTGQLFKTMAGLNIQHVPYKGANPALTNLIGGQVQMMFATSASVVPFIRQHQLRALAVTSAKRMPDFPQLPTMIEAGLPGFEAVTWHGIVVPTGTPPAIIQHINQAMNTALKSSEITALFKSLGVQAEPGTPAAFAGYIKSEIPKWTKMVKDSGARVE
jgi:tripartite-type tricarboxylate transporter receptor subunit TctC